jgi:hypothetical protein
MTMTMTTWMTAAALLLTTSAPAFAARIVGNGGVGVRCPAPPGESRTELLDFYQARRAWGMQPALGGDPSLGYLARARLAVDRIAAVDPARGALYRGWLDAFPGEMLVYNDDQHFALINDFGDPLLQSGCSVVQIAVQRPPENPEDKRYLIDGSLWQRLDENNKAGLVLHEIVYRDALERGHTDSVAAHYFTALYASEKFASGFEPDELRSRLRLYDMDAYIFTGANNPHQPDHQKFLYFADAPRTIGEAIAFCNSLGRDAGLPVSEDFTFWQGSSYDRWKESAIGRQLLAQGPTELWLQDGGQFTFGVIPAGDHNPTQPKAATVCWVNTAR